MASSVPPRPPGSKAEYVYEVLRDEIAQGALTAGAAVRQDEIAKRLSVSITPVREALRRLESERLIEYHSHRGATVSELSPEATQELYLLRAQVEGLCARLAADRITPEQLDELRQLHEQMRHEKVAQRLAEHSRQFHQLIAQAGGPAFISGHLRGIWKSHPVPVSVSLWQRAEAVELFLDAHGDLLDALTAGDADAAERLMVAHVERAGDTRAELT